MPPNQPEERARKLLLDSLNEDQRKTFKKDKIIQLTGSEGNTYQIRCSGSISGNITWLDEGFPRGQYCAHPALRDTRGVRLPKDDLYLGQLLHLVTDENGFLSESYLQSGSYPATFKRTPRVQSNPFPGIGVRGRPIRMPAEVCTCALCTGAIARLRTIRP